MDRSDVEMEDAGKLPLDKVESANEVLGAKVEYNPSDAVFRGEANKSENGGGVLFNVGREADNERLVNMEMEDQVNLKSESVEAVNSEIPVEEQTNGRNVNEDQISTKTKSEEETGAEIAMEEQPVAKAELLEENAANVRVETENYPGSGVEDGNRVEKVMEEEHGEVIGGKFLKEPVRENGDCVENVPVEEKVMETAANGSHSMEDMQLPADISVHKALQRQNGCLDEVKKGEDGRVNHAANVDKDKTFTHDMKEQVKDTVLASPLTGGTTNMAETVAKDEGNNSSPLDKCEPLTPNSLVRSSPSKVGDKNGQTVETLRAQATPTLSFVESGDGTPEDQAAFMKELQIFYRERAVDFKPPKFYGKQLNCLKLWRAVIRLGGYERVTGLKLWRQVGESFQPPKTCTTVSWTFRIFYEKSLLEYERHRIQSGALQLPVLPLSDSSGIDKVENSYQGSESGRARRGAAARATQGWHVQQLFDGGEVGDPVIKDKNLNNMPKCEKSLKSIGSLKQKRLSEVEDSIKIARTETYKQLVPKVIDDGPQADWVKINVRQTKDCFEVYALVPGLSREEVRVQSDPAGHVVITGQPEQVDNPWGITPFKKVVTLPARVDPLRTSAVVNLTGYLLVRLPLSNQTSNS